LSNIVPPTACGLSAIPRVYHLIVVE